MAVRRKIYISNEICFITFTIHGWKPIFISGKYCDLAYKWFDHMREVYGNKIYGYVIMPDHIHALVQITDRAPRLPVFIMNAKRFIGYGLVDLLEEDNKIELLQYFAKYGQNKTKEKHKFFQPKL